MTFKPQLIELYLLKLCVFHKKGHYNGKTHIGRNSNLIKQQMINNLMVKNNDIKFNRMNNIVLTNNGIN